VYYAHWEHQVFGAIQQAVLRALRDLAVAFSIPAPSTSLHIAIPAPPPLFKVIATSTTLVGIILRGVTFACLNLCLFEPLLV